MDDHLSRDRLQRASPSRPKSGATNTRTYSMTEITKPDRLPVRPVLSCTAWGLSCPLGCPRGGELLPRHFTLTYSVQRHRRRYIFCDTFRHLTITMKCPGFHQACCRAVSGLSSESRRKQRSSPARSKRRLYTRSPKEASGNSGEAGRLGDWETWRGGEGKRAGIGPEMPPPFRSGAEFRRAGAELVGAGAELRRAGAEFRAAGAEFRAAGAALVGAGGALVGAGGALMGRGVTALRSRSSFRISSGDARAPRRKVNPTTSLPGHVCSAAASSRKASLFVEIASPEGWDHHALITTTQPKACGAVENPMHIHDWQATFFHPLGLDHKWLTSHCGGQNFRLTETSGTVFAEILSRISSK
jgi:hypothetical protein